MCLLVGFWGAGIWILSVLDGALYQKGSENNLLN